MPGAKRLRAIGYVRQSRESQAAASPEAQRRAIEDYARSQGWRLVDVISDIGRSGYDPKVRRPGLETVLQTVEGEGVDRVVVWKVDRLTRRGITEALTIVERIKHAGAALVSVTEPFDTSSALGEGIFALLLSLARAESEKLAERVRSGKTVVRERGGWLGGPVPYGFTVERVERVGHTASRLVLDPTTSKVVRTMADHVLAGGSVSELVRQLERDGVAPPRGKHWSRPSVFGLLRSPVLAGYLPDGHSDVLRDEHGKPVVHGEALLTEAEWRKLQQLVVPRKGRRPQQPSLLGGIARCAGCGGPMGGDRSQNQYRCGNGVRGFGCTAPARVPMDATDEAVVFALEFTVVTNYKEDPASLERLARWWALRDTPTDVEALGAERDDIEAARARLREMNAAGDFADDPAQYRKLFDRYNQRYEQITTELAEYESLPPPKVVSKAGFIDSLDFTTKRELLGELLEIECVQAERPGVRFNAAKRLRLRFRTGIELRELTVA